MRSAVSFLPERDFAAPFFPYSHAALQLLSLQWCLLVDEMAIKTSGIRQLRQAPKTTVFLVQDQAVNLYFYILLGFLNFDFCL